MKTSRRAAFFGFFVCLFVVVFLFFFLTLTAELPRWAPRGGAGVRSELYQRGHGGSRAAFAGTCARVNMYFLRV